MTLQVDEAEQGVGSLDVDNVGGSGDLEEVLDGLLDASLDHLRLRSFDSFLDNGGMGTGIVVGLNQISSNLERKIGLLKILVADHGADFALDGATLGRELTWVSASESLKALESIQVKLSLLLLQQVKEGSEELLRGGDRDHRG